MGKRRGDLTQPCHILLGADDDVGRWIATRIYGSEHWVDGCGTAIGFTYRDKLIAGAAFFRFNRANIEMAFASESARWMTRENIRRVFEYPFDKLGVKRITVIADASNHQSIRLNQYFGFKLEATLQQAAPDGDQLLFRMLRDECRWLRSEMSGNRELQQATPSSPRQYRLHASR